MSLPFPKFLFPTKKEANVPTPKIHEPRRGGIRKAVDHGTVQLVTELTPYPVRLSDQPRLRLTIRAKRGVRVYGPARVPTLGDFRVERYHEEPLRLEDNWTVSQKIFILEPIRSGLLRLPAILLVVADERKDAQLSPRVVATDPLAVEVTTVFGDRVPSLEELRELSGPLKAQDSNSAKTFLILAVLGLGILVVAAKIWMAHRRAASRRSPSPQEIAFLEFERLLQRGLTSRPIKEFYADLTAVVRHHVQWATGISAGEQTTEEFLDRLSRSGQVPEVLKRSLAEFFHTADLVKFAAQETDWKQIDESLRRAKAVLVFLNANGKETL